MSDSFLQSDLDQEARRVALHRPDVTDAAALAAFAETVRGFLAEKGLSQSQLARTIGASATAVSQLLSGKYEGDSATLADKVVCFINAEDRRQRRSESPVFVETTAALKIKSLITRVESFSDAEARIGVIIGDAGSGKSACLRAYAEADRGAIYVTHDSAQRVSGLLSSIARKITGLGSDGSLSAVTERLVDAIQLRRFLMLIDEASSLRAKDLDRLRTVLCVKCRCPLILAGNNDLLRTLQFDNGRAGYACLDQFTSRLIGVLNLDEMAMDGGSPLYTADDIRRLYEYGGITLSRDAVSILQRICRTPKSGRLRTCSHIVKALHISEMVRRCGEINAAMIVAAIEELGLPVRYHLPIAQWQAESPGRRLSAATG